MTFFNTWYVGYFLKVALDLVVVGKRDCEVFILILLRINYILFVTFLL